MSGDGLQRDRRVTAGCSVSAILICAGMSWAQPYIPARDLDAILHGEEDGDGFGHRVFSIGDVDDDDIDDIVVTARFNDAGGVDAGRCYLYSGVDFTLLEIFTGEGPGDELGHRTAITGDLNGDGRADFALGAYVNDAGGDNAGRVYVYSGIDRTIMHKWTGEFAGEM